MLARNVPKDEANARLEPASETNGRDEPRRASNSSAPAPTTQEIRTSAATKTNLAIAAILGLVVGIVIGMKCRSEPASSASSIALEPPDTPPATRATDTAPAPPSALELDLGTPGAAPALRDGWIPAAYVDGRAVALTSSAKATMLLHTNPVHDVTVLALVAKAVGLAENARLRVAITANDRKLSEFSLHGDWHLFAVRAPNALLAEGQLTLRFVLDVTHHHDASTRAKPAMAVDYLWLEPLPDSASVDLATARGRSQLLRGFWQAEPSGQEDPFAVWMKGVHSTAAMVLAPVSGHYQLRLRAHVFSPIGAISMKAFVNGQHVGSAQLEKLDDYVFTVPNEVLVAGSNTVEFFCSRSGRPSDFGSPHDGREVCMRVFSIALTPGIR